MSKIKAMIVDDSNFSIKVTQSILERMGADVICKAMSVKEAIQRFDENINDINFITMDITLPDGDGIDCTKILTSKKKDLNVIIVSSMLDDEIIKKSKDSGAKSCIQKPVDEEEFVSKVNRLFQSDILFDKIMENYIQAFVESATTNISRVTKEAVEYEVLEQAKGSIRSKGMSITLGLVGAHRGRVILDVSMDIATALTKKVYSTEDITQEDIAEYMVELTNIITGNAASLLNGIDRAFSLRVSPPTTFYGNDLDVVIGDVKGSYIKFKTSVGDVSINVGFLRGKTEWM